MMNNILKVKKLLDSRKNKCYYKNIKKVVDPKNKKRKGEREMKNNKGFSLVELIIVIAIMAILVGVMAPQLIKYIEKSNVSSDTQLCDSVKTAITTAMMDPAVINDPSYVSPTSDTYTLASLLGTSTPLNDAVQDTLGAGSPGDNAATVAAAVVAQLKSTDHNGAKASDIKIEIINSNNVIVYVPDGCGNGLKDSCSWVATQSAVDKNHCQGLYAGATAPSAAN